MPTCPHAQQIINAPALSRHSSGTRVQRRLPHSPVPLSPSQGLLEQAGGCIPPEQCSCLHLTEEGARVTLAPGDRLHLGCKEW